MKVEQETVLEPMSPSAQYLNTSVLSLTIIAVLELEFPLDDSMFIPLLKHVFLPINQRFSSIMVTGKKGAKKWKKVDVNVEDHLKVPIFPSRMEVDYYDECFTKYLSKLGMELLPENRPLWDVHVFKYPTKNAAQSIVFKIHHSLGDGYSLMGALLSCTQRLDNPSLPLTFPSRQPTAGNKSKNAIFRQVSRFFKGVVYTVCDFGWVVLRSSLIKDDKSPIRSGHDGVESRPTVTSTITFNIDQIKQITASLNVTINDVITGVIFLGTRLYMQKTSEGSEKAKSTAMVLLNTRAIGGYKSVAEMIKPHSKMPWGNRFAFLQIPIPELSGEDDQNNPLTFVRKAQQTIKRQRNSATPHLIAQLLNLLGKFKGAQVTSRFIHGALENASLTITNMIGPVEQIAVDNKPVKGLYFFVSGSPQSLQLTLLSYVGKLRIAISVENGFMDPNKLKSCFEYAFEAIAKAAFESPPPTKS